MTDVFDGILRRFKAASAEFGKRLAEVAADQWDGPTPCAEWDVRRLVNHVVRGNVNYRQLVRGGTGAEFLRLRDVDALDADPVATFAESVRDCAAAFAEPGALDRTLDYPLGPVSGRQALAIRTTDTLVHTWDLARAVHADERLDEDLVHWADAHLDAVYAGLPETPVSATTTHRFFAPAIDARGDDALTQHRFLRLLGRNP